MANDPLGVPEIQDKRTKPSGLLPKNAQTWAMAGLALVMVLIILFSGRSAPKQVSKDPPLPPIVDPNLPRIDDVRKRIDELADKNRSEQERIAALKARMGNPGMPTPTGAFPAATTPPAYGGRGYAYQDVNPPQNWVDPDEQKREARAPFASNVALSYRKEDAPSGQEGSDAALQSLAASLTDGGNRYPSSGSAPPQAATARNANQGEEERSASDTKRKQPSHPHRPGEMDYPIYEGTVLETVLNNRLDGYFSGPINCMLTTDVYSQNGAHVLIPSGSRVLGEVKRVDTFGQQRLATVLHRLIMPDGYSVSLDQFKGLNQIGETGLRDKVNNHYLQLFGVSIAIGAIAGLAQSNANYGGNVTGTQAYEQGVSNSLSQTSLHILDRYLNILPTLTIREGHRIKIYLTQDLMLPAYDKHVAEAELETQQMSDTVRTNGRGQEE
jgi:type IV secretory pathway VirB10-like protein